MLSVGRWWYLLSFLYVFSDIYYPNYIPGKHVIRIILQKETLPCMPLNQSQKVSTFFFFLFFTSSNLKLFLLFKSFYLMADIIKKNFLIFLSKPLQKLHDTIFLTNYCTWSQYHVTRQRKSLIAISLLLCMSPNLPQ